MALALPALQPTAASADIIEPFAVVKGFFSALSMRDGAQIRRHVTGDFQLLEHGEVWDTGRLIQAVQGDYTRRNYFQLLSQEVDRDMAWVSYWNRATFADDRGERERVWLESAVLVMSSGRWLIRMLHSTRLDSDAVPAGIEFEEHAND